MAQKQPEAPVPRVDGRQADSESGIFPRGDEWVTVAILSKPRGTRGEIFALAQTNHWERFQQGRRFTIWFPPSSHLAPRLVELEEGWSHNGKLILKFAGVDSIEDAEVLRNAELCIRAEEREPLPEGEYYYDELKGFAVVDLETRDHLGTVVGFTEGIGPGVLDVETELAEGAAKKGRAREAWQVPFAKEICVDIDLESREIRVRLPMGLRDLNRAGRDEE